MNAPFTVDDDETTAVPVAPEGWTIRTEDDAAFATDRLLALNEQIERLERQFERNRARLARELMRAQEFFGPMLEAWARAHPPRKGKTIHLATGDLSFRRVNGGLHIEDADACLEWAEEKLPEAIRREVVRRLDAERVKREASRLLSERVMTLGASVLPASTNAEAAALAAHLVAEGDRALPPGVVRTPDVETFTVNPPKGAK